MSTKPINEAHSNAAKKDIKSAKNTQKLEQTLRMPKGAKLPKNSPK